MKALQFEIDQARDHLPDLVHRVETEDDLRIEITRNGRAVAELRRTGRPVSAAERLQATIAAQGPHQGPSRDISSRVGEVLYGQDPE